MIPSCGSMNQFAASKIQMRAPVATVTARNITATWRLFPLITPAQKMPLTSEIAISHVMEILGSERKLLNSIAMYCFKRTATQKIGSENIKKAKKVIE